MTSRGLAKYAALGLAAVLGFTLSACGNAEENTEGGESAGNGEVAEFTWLHRVPDKEGAKTVNQLVEEFNEANPDIKVIPETMQGSAMESYAKINSIVEAGKDVPCLTQIGNERVPDMMGSLMDVSKYTEKYKDDFLPAFYDKARVGDQVFGFPQGASPILLFYRADLFDEYGLKVPTTWDEYKEQAKIVREKSDNKAYMGAFLTDEQLWLSALTSSEGADWFDFDSNAEAWEVKIDSPETEKVADMLQDLVDEDLIVPTQRWGQDFNKFLSDGTIVSTIGGAWEAPLIADTAPDTAGKWKVAQIPHFDASNTAVGQNGGTIAAVVKGCKYPEQAVKFAHWWSTNIEGLSGLGLLPAAKADSIETPENLKEFFSGQDIYEEFITANNNAPVVHWAPQISETFRVMGDAQAKVGQGTTVGQALKDAQKTAVDSLEAVGATVK